ncbi:MAG: 50S ribosomal protein L22 [Gammaproteobacteria bacterium]
MQQHGLTRARLTGVRMSAQKMRLVADQIRGLKVSQAADMLAFMPLKASGIIAKVLQSAVANAESGHGADTDTLYISTLYVDEGRTFKRMRPRARGRADRILKRGCHITLYVDHLQGKE